MPESSLNVWQIKRKTKISALLLRRRR